MPKYTVTTLLTLAFAVVLTLLIAIGAVGLSNLNVIDTHLGLISDEILKKYTLMMEMRQSARERSLALHRMVMFEDPFEQDSELLLFHREGAAFAAAREQLTNMPLSAVELERMEEQGKLINKNVQVQEEVANLALAGDQAEAAQLLTSRALPAQNEVFTHIDSQIRLYTEQLQDARAKAAATYQQLRDFGLFAGLLAVMSGLLVAVWSVRQIGRDQRELLARGREQNEILNGMLTGVMTINENGIIESFNRAATKIFGYEEKEAIGKSINMLLPEDLHNRHNRFLSHYFSQEDVSAFMGERELYARRADGSTFPMSIMLSKITPGEHGKRRVVASCFDITEQKEQEQRLRSSQKMDALGKLTGGIAHDYNNMLAVILGYAELLKLRVGDDSALGTYISEIHQAAERGSRLTSKLLAFTRRKPIETNVFDLNEILREDQLMLEKTLTASVQLQFQLSDEPCGTSLDRDDLENAILNIAINARHAMPEGGVLIIATERVEFLSPQARRYELAPGNYVQLVMRDTGVGMDEETLSHIFEPFYSTKGDAGTGLGMSQVYGFVKRSGGAISVRSTPGQGSRFSLIFPYVEMPEESSEARDALETAAASRRGKHILIVDDEPAICQLAAEMLLQEGYSVVTASSGSKALATLQREPIDLMLSDVIMPEMNGYQLAAKVREYYPHVLIQLMSGYSDSLDSSQVDPQLAAQLLRKPFSSKELKGRLSHLFN